MQDGRPRLVKSKCQSSTVDCTFRTHLAGRVLGIIKFMLFGGTHPRVLVQAKMNTELLLHLPCQAEIKSWYPRLVLFCFRETKKEMWKKAAKRQQRHGITCLGKDVRYPTLLGCHPLFFFLDLTAPMTTARQNNN